MKKLLPLSIALLATPAFAQDTLVLSTWGYDEAKLKQYAYEPFEKKYNVKIVSEKGNNGARLGKIRQRQGKKVDVIQLSAAYMVQAKDAGLLDNQLNTSNIPNAKDLYDFAKAPIGSGYGYADTIVNIGIAYNTKTLKPMTKWSDLWRSDLKQKLALSDISTSSGPMTVMMAADVAGVDPYKNADATFNKLKEIKPNMRKAYKRSSEVANLFNQGEIDAAVMYSFAYPRVKAGSPDVKFVTPASGGYATVNLYGVSKNSKKKDLAYKFINYMLSAEVQERIAKNVSTAPSNKNVTLSADEAKGLAYGKDFVAKLKFVDQVRAVTAQKDWTKRWQQDVLAGN